ncbi:Tetratricopeptide repeat-containing protein [Draconibacterium orientale]|uniref:Tetratricopeptide repeat-containing protein n=1 Tax=Draconibacterium orientale TaxID=1168034 RepID=X5DH96_9BACT|nr:histidine kinase [Draconibacterium orientale]AHW62373.1 hypothetical protein FH5T_20445 [Draconibacterium orientale]SET36311.1 Tetratricopeptide repeat-containing protein [Draconibacterium orientale]
MKITFCFILIICVVDAKISYCNSSTDLSDSLRMLITTQTAHDQLAETYQLIRKNRIELDEDYIPLLKEFAGKSQRVNYIKGEMQSYDIIGLEYRYQEIFDTAYVYHNKSLKLAIQEKDSTQLFYNYNNLGQVFRKQDITTLAIDYFHKALEISDAVGNLRSSSYTMNALGTTLILQKDYNRAMSYFRQSSAIAKQRNDMRTLAYNYGSMGEILLAEKQADSAMYYFDISRDMLVQTGSDSGMGVAEHLIGKAFLAKKDYTNARSQFQKALAYHIKSEDLRYQAYCNSYLGKIENETGNYAEAKKYFDLAKSQSEQVNSLKNLMEIYSGYVGMYKGLAQWKNAYEANEKRHAYADSILNEKSKKTIAALEIGFETKKKEQQIELLSAENKLKNQRLRVGVILLIVLVFIIILIFYILQIRKKQALLKQTDLQQQVLRSQMNPHFIFNVLGSIQNYMLANSPKEAAGYLSQFASLTRATLEYSSEDTISLSDEIAMLRNYMELEQIRKPGIFEFVIEKDDELESDFIQVPPMMIQPFIENAIKHGFQNIDYVGKLRLSITDKLEYVEVVVQDDGVGIETTSESSKKHRSMAMEIFEKRRKLIQHKFNKDFIFDISNLKNLNPETSGVKVTLQIPVLDND